MPDDGLEIKEYQDQTLEQLERISAQITHDEKAGAKQRRLLDAIGLSTALLSCLAAVCAMKAGYQANLALINRVKASDQWALYQSKSTKEHLEKLAATMENMLQADSGQRSWKDAVRIRNEKAEIKKVAESYEKESAEALETHERFAQSVAAAQIAIAMGGIAALTKSRTVWIVGLAIGMVGIVLISPLGPSVHSAISGQINQGVVNQQVKI